VRVLDRYIVRTILGSVSMVAAALVVLGALFTFIDPQQDIGSMNMNDALSLLKKKFGK